MMIKKLNESLIHNMDRYLKEDLSDIKDEVIEFFDEKGYDISNEDILAYADGVAEYIDMVRDEYGEYTLDQWYKDTRMNYPEDISFLENPNNRDNSDLRDGWDKWEVDQSRDDWDSDEDYYPMLTQDDMNSGQWYESLNEDDNFDSSNMKRSELIDAIDDFYREDHSSHYLFKDKTIEDLFVQAGASEDDSDEYEGLYVTISTGRLVDIFNIIRKYLLNHGDDYSPELMKEFRLKKSWAYDESLKESKLDEFVHPLAYAKNVRWYSDRLFNMIEEGAVDAKSIAKDLIYWCSEDDIKRYMEVNDLISYDED